MSGNGVASSRIVMEEDFLVAGSLTCLAAACRLVGPQLQTAFPTSAALTTVVLVAALVTAAAAATDVAAAARIPVRT